MSTEKRNPAKSISDSFAFERFKQEDDEKSQKDIICVSQKRRRRNHKRIFRGGTTVNRANEILGTREEWKSFALVCEKCVNFVSETHKFPPRHGDGFPFVRFNCIISHRISPSYASLCCFAFYGPFLKASSSKPLSRSLCSNKKQKFISILVRARTAREEERNKNVNKRRHLKDNIFGRLTIVRDSLIKESRNCKMSLTRVARRRQKIYIHQIAIFGWRNRILLGECFWGWMMSHEWGFKYVMSWDLLGTSIFYFNGKIK